MLLIKKIVKSSFWLLLGNMVGRSATFIITILAARMLSQDMFGQFTLLRSTISLIEGVLSGALGSAIIKRVSQVAREGKEERDGVISVIAVTNLLLVFLLAVILNSFSSLIMKYLFIGEAGMLFGLKVGVVLLIATNLSSLVQSILIGFEDFKALTFAGIKASFLSIPLSFFLIYNFSLYGAIVSATIYSSLDFLFKYISLKKKITISFSSGVFVRLLQDGKALIFFSAPLFLSIIINSISFLYVKFLVVNAAKGFANIAVFDAAFQWLTIIMIVTGATTSVALPMLSKAFKNSNRVEISRVFGVNFAVNFGISIIFAFLFSAFSKNIMAIYGDDYIHGYKLLIILSLTSVFFTLSSILNKYVIVINKQWLVFLSSLIGSLSVLAVVALTIRYLEYSLAYGYFAFYFVSCAVYAGGIYISRKIS